MTPAEKGWWAQSTEDPWQCLAACIELTAALRSPDPHAYVSRLPGAPQLNHFFVYYLLLRKVITKYQMF